MFNDPGMCSHNAKVGAVFHDNCFNTRSEHLSYCFQNLSTQTDRFILCRAMREA